MPVDIVPLLGLPGGADPSVPGSGRRLCAVSSGKNAHSARVQIFKIQLHTQCTAHCTAGCAASFPADLPHVSATSIANHRPRNLISKHCVLLLWLAVSRCRFRIQHSWFLLPLFSCILDSKHFEKKGRRQKKTSLLLQQQRFEVVHVSGAAGVG